MSALDKEPVKRVEKFLKNFDQNLNVMLLDTSARTALEAASSLKCDVGAIVKRYILFFQSFVNKSSPREWEIQLHDIIDFCSN